MNASVLKREIETLLGLQGTQAASFWRIAATPSAPGPVPIPYPNFAAGGPITVHGAGRHFDGDYVLTSVQHGAPSGSYKDDLIECVRAAAAGDAAAARARPIWLKVRLKLDFQPAPVRAALVDEITQTLRQRGGRP